MLRDAGDHLGRRNADQVQQRVEAAYFTQQKTFSEHLVTECIPKIERVRQAGLTPKPEVGMGLVLTWGDVPPPRRRW